MPRWFLSYNSIDVALAERLKSAIERKDSASRVSMTPPHRQAGGSWSPQLSREIAEANGFILLIGAAGVGIWQVCEYDEALDNWVRSGGKFPLIVALLEKQTAPGLPLLRQMRWIITPDPASENAVARILSGTAGGDANPGELWRHTSPYRGLEAMDEKDSDYFFGRTRETVKAINALAAHRLALLIGNSGVGKSSLARAGVLAALKRQAWPVPAPATHAWPAVFQNSRQWCLLSFKPGGEPLKALVECFLETWQFAATDPERVRQQHRWIELLRDGKAKLSDLIAATERRRTELDQPKPPGFFLYVDQGEELYGCAVAVQRRRFCELLAQALPDPRLRAMMSLRSDFLGHLRSDESLFAARQQIDVPALGETELREVVSRPAQLLGARFETEALIDIIACRAADDPVKNVGALPLLSYTLEGMWRQMVRRGDGTLRLAPESFDLGGVLVDRANAFLTTHPGTETALRRVLTLRCAAVHGDGEPTRRRAPRDEFSEEEWRLVGELAGGPDRLLVIVTTGTGESYAEVAHEAIFRRWHKLCEWIAADREFLVWRSALEAARRAWQGAPVRSKGAALLMGYALAQAQSWEAKRGEDVPAADRTFILQSRQAAQRRLLRAQALVGVLVATIIAGAAAWWSHDWLKERSYALTSVHPLEAAQESALKPQANFQECRDCPEMIVVPAGGFMMGSPAGQGPHDEHPQHEVTIAKRFAVAKNELTFAEWDACAAHGDCVPHVGDGGWGRGRQPAINVSWDDAQTYVAWISRITGMKYRLLSEAEYEYAARAGTQTAYPWGDDIGTNNADCDGCGSQWDGRQTAPVGSFAANRFGLYDMVGNVWEWVEDCYHDSYNGAPTDGLAWTAGDCSSRVVRGGSWVGKPGVLRSANRFGLATDYQSTLLGFRLARTLSP
jgi:formylglycine-generating enzyme required for sulfatase activity